MIWQLKVLRWPKVELERLGGRLDDSHHAVVPDVCPNCMAEATGKWRTQYTVSLLLPFTKIYRQTFYYCDACSDIIRHFERNKVIQWIVGIVLFAAAGFVIWVAYKNPSLRPLVDSTFAPVSLLVIALGVSWLIGVLRRKAKPLPPNALVRGFAAYYTRHDFFTNVDIYHARRQEWLDLLVAANPDLVSDDLYLERTGKEKPREAPIETPTEKPF